MRTTSFVLAFIALVATPAVAQTEDVPKSSASRYPVTVSECPNSGKTGPFGSVVSLHIDGKYLATGVAISPDLIIALTDGKIRQAAPGTITVGWFASMRKKPVTLLGYDAGLGLAVLKPDEPMKSCACLDSPAADETRVLIGRYDLIPDQKDRTLVATGGTLERKLPDPDIAVSMHCDKKGCTDRFIGGAVMSVRTGKTVGIVARDAGHGKVHVLRASFLYERIKAVLSPPADSPAAPAAEPPAH